MDDSGGYIPLFFGNIQIDLSDLFSKPVQHMPQIPRAKHRVAWCHTSYIGCCGGDSGISTEQVNMSFKFWKFQKSHKNTTHWHDVSEIMLRLDNVEMNLSNPSFSRASASHSYPRCALLRLPSRELVRFPVSSFWWTLTLLGRHRFSNNDDPLSLLSFLTSLCISYAYAVNILQVQVIFGGCWFHDKN